ncbi:MAG: DNA gyrase subunit A, partial [Alphaproteobacteria bacterium]|nr:DNA gyrase subunit A [Alphaproteobacteria bacterium]
LLHLLHHPDATTPDLVRFVPGPDFPTGGSLVEPPESILTAYETGRGSFRTRARWQVEKLKNGTWQIIVTEIPYQVQKSRLIERIAELLNDKKLMLLGDVRDESAEDIRLVLEPRSRTVDPALLMESLFRLTDLETRFPLNLNVLDSDGVPRVMGLGEVLRAYLAHRDEVLIRRTNHRLAAIDRRLEILGGLLVAYLNLDEVIRIIREEDEPKPVLIERFQLTDIQATAILDMRLRHLRKLEEMEIRREHDQLTEEREWLHAMVNDPMLRRAELEKQLRETETAFGSGPLGNRRTSIDVAVPVVELPTEALVEKEPITVLCSTKGWVRALKGHDIDPAEVKYKDGDGERFLLKCDTTAKLLLFASDGKFYTLGADKLPRGRGFGEPVRLMIDLGNDQDIVAFEVYQPGAKRLLVASDGRGFLVNEDDALAQTRSGKQVMLPGDDATAIACLSLEGDHVAVIGTNRKLLIFPIAEIPDMARGRGVILQKYTDGKLSDLKLITLAAGLTYRYGEKTKTVTDLRPWLGKRASGGRLPPPGFPRTNRF